MNNDILSLEPGRVWFYFNEILQIPRPSGKEEKIAAYLKAFGEKHGLSTKLDKVGNVLITKPAAKGFENSPVVVLQSHVDMVCEKNSGIQHDFEKDAIKAVIEDGWLIAKETTLGADNGIGVAMQLAMLEDKSLQHGTIECLFTVDEETGLKGASSLSPDFLKGRILINLDSEEDGEFTIGCAGGKDTVANYFYTKENVPVGHEAVHILISGLQGGHSGEDINKGRGNAVKMISRFIWNGVNAYGARLSYVKGGNLRNAIAREAHAVMTLQKEKIKDFIDFTEKLAVDIRAEYQVNEPQLAIAIEHTERPAHVIDAETEYKLINSLYACPHGVISMSPDIPGLVQTSTNLASVKMKGFAADEAEDKEIPVLADNQIKVGTSQRSAIESAKKDVVDMVESAFNRKGIKVSHNDGYPGWKPDIHSYILEVSRKAHKELFGIDPIVKAIHAGLECGLIGEKYQGIDMISIGPSLLGVHAPGEKIEIHTVKKCWDLLLQILKSA
jgi:dipeptidase D